MENLFIQAIYFENKLRPLGLKVKLMKKTQLKLVLFIVLVGLRYNRSYLIYLLIIHSEYLEFI